MDSGNSTNSLLCDTIATFHSTLFPSGAHTFTTLLVEPAAVVDSPQLGFFLEDKGLYDRCRRWSRDHSMTWKMEFTCSCDQ